MTSCLIFDDVIKIQFLVCKKLPVSRDLSDGVINQHLLLSSISGVSFNYIPCLDLRFQERGVHPPLPQAAHITKKMF